ncbi:MAG: pbpY [Caulobacteraceae bacterium]|nr:pbpY [Caulobacteraceae bacterium]
MDFPRRGVAIAGLTVLGLITAACLSLAIYSAFLFHDLPDAGDLVDYRPPTASRVYAWDGTLIGEFSTERRIFVPYDQMPPRVVEAFMSAEDKNFFKHGGVDVQGTSRALIKDVFNILRGRRPEGGSTITQQVAKNILLTNDVTIGRKIKEAILSQRLEQTLSKERILELYLNEIWLGYRSYGVGAAAYNYFGKPLGELDLEEAAYLAALPKGPDNYQPLKRKAQAISRRNWVISQMAQEGYVTASEAAAAQKADLVVQLAPSRAQYRDADFFVAEVRRQTVGALPRIDQGGYYLRTTLDKTLQSAAQTALMDGLERYDRRHGWRGAFAHAAPGEDWKAKALAQPAPSERGNWRAAEITLVNGGEVRVQTASEGATGALIAADVAWAKAGRGLNAGDLVFVEKDAASGGWKLKQVPLVNGALVALEPYSGRIVSMVGGYSYSLSKFNRATQAWRQPGSSFKPFVYATALENGFTPATVITDQPVSYRGADGKMWTPENYEKEYYGALPLRRGIELSINGMTVQLAQMVGMRKIVDTAKKFGVVDQMDPVLAMALGAGETTPMRLTGAYASFLNGGRKITPHLVEEVEDAQGKAVLRADKRDCAGCKSPFNGEESPRVAMSGEQLIDPITAYQMTSFMQGVVQRGTGAAASSLGYPLAGKTGTTSEFRSAWFVGFSANLVVGVFVGRDDNISLGEGETGAQAALPIWMDFMRVALKGQPKTAFLAPPNTQFRPVNGIMEAFRPGAIAPTQPTDNAQAVVAPNPSPAPPEAPPPPNLPAAPPPSATAPPPPGRPVNDLGDLY